MKQPLPLAEVEECGVRFATGVPVSFPFIRNTEKSEYFGPRFQQDIEPAGIYLLHACGTSGALPPNWRSGVATFRSPLVIHFNTGGPDAQIYGDESWKAHLRLHYNKERRALTRALITAYDGIITVDLHSRGPDFTREIVALDPRALKY